MPTFRERFAGLILGPEKKKLEQGLSILQAAYLDGPYQLPPEELARQLQETDSALLQDLLTQMAWDNLGSLTGQYQTVSEQARKRAVDESRRLWTYAPLAQWAVQTWTNYGLGEAVTITCDDPGADEIWQETWKADRNEELFSDDRLHEISNWTLIDGNCFLGAFAAKIDGEVTFAEIPSDEIIEILCDPENSRRPFFYKRQFSDTSGVGKILYYPDWQVFFESPEELDKFPLPQGALRADEQNKDTAVCILHISHNRKVRGSLWGWPILGIAAPYVRSHKRFMEDRLTITAAKAMYVRKIKVQGGSRAVSHVRAKLQSTMTSANVSETNPPAAAGSTWIENQAADMSDLSMGTGAGDAKPDNEMFAWMALIGMGLFPTSAGLDTSRWATALAMDKTQSMQWSRYQTFWSAQLRKIVKITLNYKELYGSQTFTEKGSQISIDSFSLVDFQPVVSSMSQMVSTSLTPLVQSGIVPKEGMAAIAQQLWRVALKALGVEDTEITSDTAFGIGVAAEPPPPAPPVQKSLGEFQQALVQFQEALKEAEDEGHWVTINGNPVFLGGKGGGGSGGSKVGGGPTITGKGSSKYNKDDAEKALATLPPSSLKGVREVSLEKFDDFKRAGHPDAAGYYAQDGVLHIQTEGRSQKHIDETIRHELGHHVQQELGKVKDQEWIRISRTVLEKPSQQQLSDFWYPIRTALTSKDPSKGQRELFASAFSLMTGGKMSSAKWSKGQYKEIKDYMGKLSVFGE